MEPNVTNDSAQMSESIWAACLSTKGDSFPCVVFYRFARPTESDIPPPRPYFDDKTMHFRLSADGLCSDIMEGDVRKYTESFQVGDVLGWLGVQTIPESLAAHLMKKFQVDGLPKWQVDPNAYGLLDESIFRKHCVPGDEVGFVIEDCCLWLMVNAWDKLRYECPEPSLLLVEASVIELEGLRLWRVIEVYRRIYSSQRMQSTINNSLVRIGTRVNDMLVLLICPALIVEHLAKHAIGFTEAIVDAMLKYELALALNMARRRIADNLHRFTYRGDFKPESFKEVCKEKWLEPLLGGFGDKNRYEFYVKVLANSNNEIVRNRCSLLSSCTSAVDNTISYSNLFEDALGTGTALDTDERYILLFDFLGKDYLVGLPPEDLAAGADGDIPLLDVSQLSPVLVRSDLENGHHLGLLFKRVATIRARVRSQVCGGPTALRIADFLADVTEDELLNYDNGLLKHVLRARTPFHERRLLQMIGIPCRQALGDVFHDRVCAGLHPLPKMAPKQGSRPYQSRDDVVFEVIKKYIALEQQLQRVQDMDGLQTIVTNVMSSDQSSLLDKLAIVRKIASFHESLANTPLGSFLDRFTAQLDDQGHALAASVCKTVRGLAGNPIDTATAQNEYREWVCAFWSEIGECFPDYGPGWYTFRDKAYERMTRGEEGNRNDSAYRLFVLASVFDRQITTFYKPEGRYIMPYDAMMWAVNSVHRLHMMSALLQMCCGDWACEHRAGDILSRRLIWNHRLAASAKIGRAVEDGLGTVPMPCSERRSYCNNGSCRHISTDPVLNAVGTTFHFDASTLSDVLQKMGWWFNGLLDEGLHDHFRCKCGAMMAPIIQDRKFRKFGCPNNGANHDDNVYLTWCIHSQCSNVIDSRIENRRCSNRFLICAQCGTCCLKHKGEHAYSENEAEEALWIPACHACSRKMLDAWAAMKTGLVEEAGQVFVCADCNTENIVYPSRKAWWSCRGNETSVKAAIQWGMMDKYFEYNLRPAAQDSM